MFNVKTILIVRCVRWWKDERLLFLVPVEDCFGGWPRHGYNDDGSCASGFFWRRKCESEYILLNKFSVKLSSLLANFDFSLQFSQMTGRDDTAFAVLQGYNVKVYVDVHRAVYSCLGLFAYAQLKGNGYIFMFAGSLCALCLMVGL